MYVCICNGVTDNDIRDAVYDGARNMRDLAEQLDVGTCCGTCKGCAKQVMRQAKAEMTCASIAAVMPVPVQETCPDTVRS